MSHAARVWRRKLESNKVRFCSMAQATCSKLVGRTAMRTCVAVTSSPQGGAFVLADGIMLDSDADPMVNRVLKSVAGRQSARQNDGLAGASGNQRHAAETSQSLIVSPPYGVMRFCEQRGRGRSCRCLEANSGCPRHAALVSPTLPPPSRAVRPSTCPFRDTP